MQYVISIAATCPLRRESSYKSEMVTQLLFCEQAIVLQQENNFSYVCCLYDNYEGWCMSNQLAEIPAVPASELKGYIHQHGNTALINNNIIQLPLGVPIYEDIEAGEYKIQFHSNNYLLIKDVQANGSFAKQLALQFLNTPYLWSGKSSFGIDCSGFTQQVFKMMGIYLPRDAYQQATFGQTINFLQEAIPGDLAFFDNEASEIIHTGILLNNNTIIHAAGYVHIDPIDDAGIIHSVTENRTHKLRIIKRMF